MKWCNKNVKPVNTRNQSRRVSNYGVRLFQRDIHKIGMIAAVSQFVI